MTPLAKLLEAALFASPRPIPSEQLGQLEPDASPAAVQAALGELREIAHGIFPTVLAEDGVVAAVDVLLDDSEIPVTDEIEDVRLPAAVEVAAYRLFAQALAVPGDEAALRLATTPDGVAVEVEITGANGAPVDLDEVEDRFAALHGAVRVEREGDRLRLHGRLPLDPAEPVAGGWAA